jgi:integrase
MRGNIRKRGKNSYSITISTGRDPITGKYKQEYETVKFTKKDAERRLSELLHQIDNGTFMKPSKTTLGEFLERWIRDYVWPNLAPRTAEGYEAIIRKHLIPELGHIPLTQLKPENLQKYYADRLANGRCDGKGGLNPLTVRHHHTVLHKALQTAVEWGLLSRNIADAVRAPRIEPKEMQTWDEDDIAQFVEFEKDNPYYALFHTALFTAIRRSELLALRWSDVDLIFCQVSINRSLHQLKDGSYVLAQPKSAKSRRTIALSPSAVLTLEEHRKTQEAQRSILGIPLTDDDLIFSKPDGSPLRPDTVTRAWKAMTKRAGKPICLHNARHTHASLMLKQGTHPKIVQERLGHATIAVTLDMYSHVAPGLQEAAAASFDNLVLPKQESVPEKK